MTGGTFNLYSGGIANANTINSATNFVVSSGGTASTTAINSAGTLNVLAGGEATTTTVNSAGVLTVSSGGTASTTAINSAGTLNVLAGGLAISSTVNTSGIFNLLSGGSATFTLVNSAGKFNVSSGGVAISTTFVGGGSLDVTNGGLVSATTLNLYDALNISSGGSAVSTTVNSGGILTVLAGGTASSVTQNSGGGLITSIGSGVQVIVSGNNISGGFYASSSLASNIILNTSSLLTVLSGGTASSTTVNSGGTQNILSGGSTVLTVLNNGGVLNVSNGGIASGTIVQNGGAIYVSNGGESWNTSIGSGGNEYILSGGYGPSATILSGGTQTIFAGGLDSSSTISAGGSQLVAGTATAASVFGLQTVSSGGMASSTTINSGGLQSILGGGNGIAGVVQTGGAVNAATGSLISGYTISGSGASILASGTVTSATAGTTAIQIASGNSNTINLVNASLNGDVIVSAGSGNTLSVQSGTTIANGVSLVDSGNSNTLVLNKQTLNVATTPTTGATTVTGWNQVNLVSASSLGLAGNLALGGTSSTLNIDGTSFIYQTPTNVIVTAGTVNNAGTVALAAGQTLTVSGNYNQTGALNVGFNGSNYGKLAVSGAATLGNSASYSVAPGSQLKAGTTYRNVVSATTLSGTFNSGSYNGIRYSFVVDGTGLDLVTATATSAATLLNGGQANAMLNQAQATIQVIRDRMEKIGGSTTQGVDSNSYFWATPYGYSAKQNATGNIAAGGYRQNTGGFAMGADTPVSDELKVGAALLLQTASLKGSDSVTQAGINGNSYQLAVYAKQKFSHDTELNLIANAAVDQNKTSRLVDDGSATPLKATASNKGWYGLLSGELGQRIALGQSTFTPLVRLDYGYANVGAYSESGAGALNLAVNGQTQTSTIGSLGVKYRYDINPESRFFARVIAGHDFSAKAATLTAADGTGTRFTSYGITPGSFVMQAGVGYEVQAKNNMRLKLNYDYLGRNNGYSNNMINASLIVPF